MILENPDSLFGPKIPELSVDIQAKRVFGASRHISDLGVSCFPELDVLRFTQVVSVLNFTVA